MIDLKSTQAATAIDLVRSDLALEEDDSIRTAVVLSLFTDRRAAPDDELPEGANGDRRGWWGDTVPVTDPAGVALETDRIGSRLWLLTRAKQTQDTLNRAVGYAREALQWLLEDGIAGTVDIEAEWVRRGVLGLRVTISGLGREDFRALFTTDLEGR